MCELSVPMLLLSSPSKEKENNEKHMHEKSREKDTLDTWS